MASQHVRLLAFLVFAICSVRDAHSRNSMACDCRVGSINTHRMEVQCHKVEGVRHVTCQKELVPHLDKGYQYKAGFGMYRFNLAGRNWIAAKEACEAEGAHLAVPETQAEMEMLRQMIREQPGKFLAWIGYSDRATEGTFVSVTGEPLAQMQFKDWEEGEPNDNGGDEDCVILVTNGLLNDNNCWWARPFLCEKPLNFIIPSGYVFYEGLGFYKVYSNGRNFTEARKTCQRDGARLAVPETEHEAEVLVKQFVHAPSAPDMWIGVNDIDNEGFFVTELGNLFSSNRFQNWWPGEPNNVNDNEDCVTIHIQGTFNDRPCSDLEPFICEITLEA